MSLELDRLGIEHIAAYSPEARGRSERMFGTLQERLPKELKLAGITDIDVANRFLREVYLPAHNARRRTGYCRGNSIWYSQVPRTARFAALQSGAVDATILGAPFDNRAEAAGFSNLGLTMEYVKDLPFSGYVVNKAWASGNLATIRRFLAAYQKSVDWFYEDQNRDQAIKLVVDLAHGDQADVARSYEFLRKIEFFEKAGRISMSEMRSLVGVLKQIGILDREMGTDALVMQGVTP